MKRREFVKFGVLTAPALAPAHPPPEQSPARLIAAGTDFAGESHTLGFSKISFKTSSSETGGGLFVMEHSNLLKGGPFRHVHPAQDEWLYAMDGLFHVEIGDRKFVLQSGDSVLMPRKIPHVWAQVGETPGRLLIVFTPAGRMEDFFRDFGKTGKLPTDVALVKTYGLERVGPPLTI
jgi:quercetin dioxygenase-like cupin family protein